jgi:acetyl-CoA C-acetyltransferase
MANGKTVWLAGGLRTPFTRVDGGLAGRDAIGLSVPVVQAMTAQVAASARVDFAVWGSVIPNLGYANLAREVWLDAKLDPTVPTFTTIMQCSTSMVAAFEAAGFLARGVGELALAGGSESMTHVQTGLAQPLSDWMRRFVQARDLKQRAAIARELPLQGPKLHVQSIKNRTTGKSMGEHSEETAKTWEIGRAEQDEVALESHRRAVAAQERGFFARLVVPVDGVERDAFPRKDTSMEALGRLPLAFDRTSGKGTHTAGNSSPLTDGAAALWVATDQGLKRLPSSLPRARLVDFELGAVDIARDGLLMAPAFAIPRLLARNGLGYADVGLWEIHEAFAAQVLYQLKALDSSSFVRDRAGVTASLGAVPRDRINPNGGSVALGHPFGATGARILAQAVAELAERPPGTRALVSICADGGVGTVALLERG